ncbi:sigma factor-like helix-turn-helix DNA-binding protein [Bacillus cytotoxicus]|uniref:sigma factor-like helix-turn-helix DNA-binding protein n=1 Tax=Bacillus cytotoxicus TaxID=580165 RepID=UPI0035CA977E
MFDWLKDYQKLKEEIAYLEHNLEKTELELDRWVNGDLREVRLTEGSKGARVEEMLEQIKKELFFKKEQMNKLLDLVNDFKGLENQILKLKYIDGMTLEEVAEHVNYSVSHIKKKHAELVRLIQFIEKKGII